MCEKTIRDQLKEMIEQMGYDEYFCALLCIGVDRMPQEEVREALQNLKEYEHQLPELLKRMDALINDLLRKPK